MEERNRDPNDGIGKIPIARGEQIVGTLQYTNLERRGQRGEGKASPRAAGIQTLVLNTHLTIRKTIRTVFGTLGTVGVRLE